MSRRHPPYWPVVLCVIVLIGCGGFYLGKPKLEGQTSDTGLLIIDCAVHNQHGTSWFEDTFFSFDWADLTGGTVKSDDGTEYKGKELKNLIIISGLPAGGYKLSQIKAKKTYRDESAQTYHFTYNIPSSFADSLPIDIVAGQPTFVGRIFISELRDPTDYFDSISLVNENPDEDIYKMKTDPCYEVDALRKFLNYYEDSDWTVPVKARLDELQRVGQADCE